MNQLILSLGFVELSRDPHIGSVRYHHQKFSVTFEPVPNLTLQGLGEALITAGMAVQKLETMEIITEAAKKLGFKF